MNIVFFAHPSFLGHQSMPRFAGMLADGMQARGHTVQLLAPQLKVSRLPSPRVLHKWLHYVDQYVVFPNSARRYIKQCPPDTLFVLTDHALGPWVPLVAHRPHVVHCHDFLAQRSAMGQLPENPTSWSGRLYQRYIRQGYSQAQHFISVSLKTQKDLLAFLPSPPASTEVIYNGLNQKFAPADPVEARTRLSAETGLDLTAGYLLHIGGNQWYKNRVGILEIYTAWRQSTAAALPLLLIGEQPTPALHLLRKQSAYQQDIHFLQNVPDQSVQLAYSGAAAFLFPSLAEGFGWPIAEAMASGCLVVTTDEAPMTEVAGNAAWLIPRRPNNEANTLSWAQKGARALDTILQLTPAQRQTAIAAGIANAKRFDPTIILNQIERSYLQLVAASADRRP